MNKISRLGRLSLLCGGRPRSFLRLLCVCMAIIFVWPNTPARAAFTFDPALNWYSLHSEHFNIHFHDGEQDIAQRAAQICEQQYLESGKLFDWYPDQATEVVLINTLDISNAAATPLPVNTMLLFLPASDDPGEDYDDWLRHLITHEYTHIVHLDKAIGAYDNLRDVFGRAIPFFPNLFQPSWVIEGLATYRETRPGEDIGRGQSSMFRSLMQIEWEQGLKPIRQVNLPIVSWPGGVTRYLYGVYFFNFVRDRYGEDAIQDWVAEYSRNIIPWSFNSASYRQFNRDMSDMWDEFNRYLQQQFQPVIDAVNAEGATQGDAVSHSGYYTANLKVLADGSMYYISNDLLAPPRLMRLATSSSPAQAILDIYGQSYDVSDNGIVFNQHELQHNTNYYYEIYRADKNGDHPRQLTHGGRYPYVLWAGDNIIAVQQNGISERIELLDQDGQVLKTLWQGKPGEIISKPTLSKDGASLVAAVWRAQSHWEIELLDINSGVWRRLTDHRGNEAAPVFSQDGKSIYFIADYQHAIYNIYRMSLSGKQLQRLSNDLHGITEVAEVSASELGYVGLNAKGSDIYRIAATTPFAIDSKNQRKLQRKETPAQENINSANYPVTPYSALSKIKPSAWYPYFYVDSGIAEWGFFTNMNDPLQRHSYSVFATYDSDNRWGNGEISYLYDRFNPALNLYVNRYVTTQSVNSQTVNWISTQQAAAALFFPWFKRDIQFRFDTGVASEKTSLIKSAIGASYVEQHSNIGMLALNLNTSKTFARSINTAQGHRIRLSRENFIDEPLIDKPAYSLDWRYYYTLQGNHSVAARLFRAKSDPNDPYQLGGNFQGTELSSISAPSLAEAYSSIHQRDYALRGYKQGLPQLSGSDVALLETEYRFPLLSIERGFMAPPLGINRIYGSVFYSAANPNWGRQRDNIYRSAGIQSSFELILGYFLPLTLQVGYAKGMDVGGEEMIYVRGSGNF